MKKVQATSLKYLNDAIEDPILRDKLTPNYTIGCKRILLSNTYYPALAANNVEVNTEGIAEITEDSVIDRNGKKIEVDTIIFGTGFLVKDLPFARHIYGGEGHSLAQEWSGSPKAYMGTMVAGFPNLFLLQGPNTGLGHSSVIYMIEAQVSLILKTIKYMKKNNLDMIEPTEKAQEQFVGLVERTMEGTVWSAGGCKSWYQDQTGRNSILWPGFTFSYRRLVAKLSSNDFVGRRV